MSDEDRFEFFCGAVFDLDALAPPEDHSDEGLTEPVNPPNE